MTNPTTPKKCNAPGGVCNRACMGSAMLGSPARSECPYPAPEEPVRESRLRMALNTWALYRDVGCGLRESFRNALRAYRSKS